MKTIDFHIRGTASLLCHNARLADPLHEWSKALAEISGKRKKTEADLIELGRREFMASLYTNAAGQPVVPGQNIERMLRDAAAKSKQGKTIQAGVIVTDECPIIYDGPKDPDKMWAAGGFTLRTPCKVGQSRVIRTRPEFMPWELKFTVTYDEGMIRDDETIQGFMELAGRWIGLGDWRPKHGRFEIL